MGNGIGTALANRVALHLGGVADEVSVARIDSYDALALVTSGDPYTMDQKTQDAAEKNPRWVPAISSATSASIGAHVGTHAAAEAARVIFRFGLWPAALELWRIAPTDPRAKDWAKARWKDRQLVMPGLPPLGLPALAATRACAQLRDRRHGPRLFPLGLVARALRFGGEQYRAEIDALAVRRGGGKFAALDRVSVKFPPTDNQPERHRLHLDVRHAGPRRDRARDRRAAHRQGLQRVRMRPGAGAGGRARPGAGRLCDGRRLCLA